MEGNGIHKVACTLRSHARQNFLMPSRCLMFSDQRMLSGARWWHEGVWSAWGSWSALVSSFSSPCLWSSFTRGRQRPCPAGQVDLAVTQMLRLCASSSSPDTHPLCSQQERGELAPHGLRRPTALILDARGKPLFSVLERGHPENQIEGWQWKHFHISGCYYVQPVGP